MSGGSTPPPQWLRTFLAVAHCGSFSEAAEHLHLTQAAVSKHIRQLEHSYGVTLFRRHGRGVELSDQGAALYPKVEQAFELLSQAEEALREDRDRVRVRLRCDATWAEAMLAPTLGDFALRFPHIQLVLSSYIWLDEIPRSQFDLHIAFSELPGLEGESLGEETAYVVCAPALRARMRRPEYRDPTPRLMLLGSDPLWQRWRELSPRDYPGPTLLSDSSIVCKRATIAGGGLSIQRDSLVHNELADGQLAKLDDIALPTGRSYYLLKQAGRALEPAQQTVWDWVRRCAATSHRSAHP